MRFYFSLFENNYSKSLYFSINRRPITLKANLECLLIRILFCCENLIVYDNSVSKGHLLWPLWIPVNLSFTFRQNFFFCILEYIRVRSFQKCFKLSGSNSFITLHCRFTHGIWMRNKIKFGRSKERARRSGQHVFNI